MKTYMEKVVSYEGDLDIAAGDVISELDDVDGVTVGTKEFRYLLKAKAREHRVGLKDLTRRVMEFLE